MKARNAFALLAAALLVSALGGLFPLGWISLQEPENVRFIGSLSQYSQPCTEKYAYADCVHEYLIPMDLLKKPSGELFPTFGLGFFLTDYALKCDNKTIYSPARDFTPTLVLDAYKVYKTIEIGSVECQDAKTLSVLSLNAKGFPTHGQISPNAIAGDRDYVSALKRTIEFFNTGLYLVFALSLLISTLANRLVLDPFLDNKERDSKLTYYHHSWITFAALKSGILEIFLLSPNSALILFRIQTFISLYAHVGTLLLGSKHTASSKRRSLLFSAILFGYLPFAFTPSFNKYMAVMLLTTSLVSLAHCIVVKKRDWRQLVFSLAALAEASKIFGAKWLPSGSISLSIIAFLEMFEFFYALSYSGALASVNLWTRKVTLKADTNTGIKEVLTDFCNVASVGRATYFSLQSNGDYLAFIFDTTAKEQFSEVHLNSVPGVLGHVIATGEALYHIPADSQFSKNLFQRPPYESFGNYYSILPVTSPKGMTGVIAVSKYKFSTIDSPWHLMRLDSYLPALAEAISAISERRLAQLTDGSFGRITKLLQETRPKKGDNRLESYAQLLLEALREEFGWYCFFAKYNPQEGTMDVLAHSFPEHKGGSHVTSVVWVIKRDNVRGPAPIAIFQSKKFIAANTDWILENLSHNSRKLLELSETKSLCVLPIRVGAQDGQDTSFGVLWVSARKPGTFDSTFERSSRVLQESIEGEMHRLVHAVIKSVFNDHVRPDIQERIMRGELPTEAGEGTLIQVDLASSTKISAALGAANWKEYQTNFVRQIRTLGQTYGLTAEMFVWDAVYLTTQKAIEPNALSLFATEALAIADDIAYQYGQRHLISNTPHPCRVCATYGDISKKVIKGSWTVNEHLIAALSKTEQAAKSSPQLLTVTAELAAHWKDISGYKKCTLGANGTMTWDPKPSVTEAA